jgi:hypothetical protein
MQPHHLEQQSRMRRIQLYQQSHRRPQLDRRHRSIRPPKGRVRSKLQSSKQRRSQQKPTRPTHHSTKIVSPLLSTNGIRGWLAMCITLLVSIVALFAAHETSADGVFGKLLPILTLVLGYYFGKGMAEAG